MKLQITLCIVFVSLLVGGCKSPTNVQGSDLGTLIGSVGLADINCDSVSDRSGIMVSIRGTMFSTHTQKNGDWELDDIPAGIYNIIIAKPGFDTNFIPQYQFAGDGTQFLENLGIHELPMDSVMITSVSATRRADSIFQYVRDSITFPDSLHGIDTFRHVYDTIYDTATVSFFIQLSYLMHGPDSSVTFLTSLQDKTGNTPGPTLTLHIRKDAILSDTIEWREYYSTPPMPGDTVVATAIVASCAGAGRSYSYTFLLP